jgi:hypothetical protein
LEGILKTIHLLLTLSILSVPLLSFAEENLRETVETLDGCTQDQEKLSTNPEECFKALRDVQADTIRFQGKIRALKPAVTELATKRDAAQAKADALTNPETKLSALPSVGEDNNAIPSKLGEMWGALTSSEQEKMKARMQTLGMTQNIKQLTYAELNRLMDDKGAKKILGCGFIDEDECDTWQAAKRYIDINRKSLLTSAQGELDRLKVEHETQASELESLIDANEALGNINSEEKAGEFFDNLQKLGMLSKLALMNARQLTDELNLGKAQLEVLKQKLGNSILGIVMDEKIKDALKKPTSELAAHKEDIEAMKVEIAQLKAKACGAPNAQTMCMDSSIYTDETPKTIASDDGGDAPTPAPTATRK